MQAELLAGLEVGRNGTDNLEVEGVLADGAKVAVVGEAESTGLVEVRGSRKGSDEAVARSESGTVGVVNVDGSDDEVDVLLAASHGDGAENGLASIVLQSDEDGDLAEEDAVGSVGSTEGDGSEVGESAGALRDADVGSTARRETDAVDGGLVDLEGAGGGVGQLEVDGDIGLSLGGADQGSKVDNV